MMALVFLAIPLLVAASEAGKPLQEVSFTTSFVGFGVDTMPVMRLQGDQQGAYSYSGGVVSYIQSSGDWVLGTAMSSPQRTILFDFRDPVPNSAPGGANPAPPFQYQQIPGRLICKGGNYGTNFQEMYGVNTTGNCALFPSFGGSDGSTYRIDMDGLAFSPGTQPALVTCVRVDSANKCNQWSIEPSAVQADGERKNIGRLWKTTPAKPKAIQTDLGKFYFSFTINVTKP
jgi:hypothetical protein